MEDALQEILLCFVPGALCRDRLVQDYCIHEANQLLKSVDKFMRTSISSHLVLKRGYYRLLPSSDPDVKIHPVYKRVYKQLHF